MVFKKLFISCIIATKDRHDEVITLIRSISNQTYSIDELIIVDSSDNINNSLDYCEVIKKYNCSVKYIKCETQGLTLQRNIGLKSLNSIADYVFFFHDDLTLNKNYIEEIIKVLETNSLMKS